MVQAHSDCNGSDPAGEWREVASMHLAREHFASQMLKDGRVLVVGAEYTGGPKATNTPRAEVYDPDGDNWTQISDDAFDWIQGDAASCMLADGCILYGSLSDKRTAIYDPSADKWIEAGTAHKTTPPTKNISSLKSRGSFLATGPCLRRA